MDAVEYLIERGFSLRTFAAYPRHLGVEKYNCVALLEYTAEGQWRQFSTAGYLLDGEIALLVERGGRRRFVHKAKQVPADGKPLEDFRRFQQELDSALAQQ